MIDNQFGPFYRKESLTQTIETDKLQEKNKQLWGKHRRNGIIPQGQSIQMKSTK